MSSSFLPRHPSLIWSIKMVSNPNPHLDRSNCNTSIKKEMKDYLHVRDVEDGERNQIDSMQRSKFSLSLILLLLKSKMANNKKKSNWFNSNVNLPCLDPSPFFLLRNGKSSLCPAAIEMLTIPLARRFIYPLTHPRKTGLLFSYWSMEVM